VRGVWESVDMCEKCEEKCLPLPPCTSTSTPPSLLALVQVQEPPPLLPCVLAQVQVCPSESMKGKCERCGHFVWGSVSKSPPYPNLPCLQVLYPNSRSFPPPPHPHLGSSMNEPSPLDDVCFPLCPPCVLPSPHPFPPLCPPPLGL